MVTTTEIQQYSTSNFPDNTSQEISAGDLRGFVGLLVQFLREAEQFSGKVFVDRASAVNYGQANLPSTMATIITIEGDAIVIRRPGYTANDPLFETSPRWGIWKNFDFAAIQAQLNGKADLASSGKMFRSRDEAVASGQSVLVPGLGIVITLESGVITWRVPFQSGDDPLFSTSPYWGVIARVDVASALRDTGVITLANVDGTGDIITAEMPLAAKRNGVAATSGTSIIEIIPIATNTGADEPTLSIDGGPDVIIKSETGAALAAGQLVGGRSYLLRRRGSVWRIMSGAVTLSDMTAASARDDLIDLRHASLQARTEGSKAPGDGVVVVADRNGKPLLGTMGDGTSYGLFKLTHSGAPGDAVAPLVEDASGKVLFGFDENGRLFPRMEESDLNVVLSMPRAPGDYIIPLILNADGTIAFGIDMRDGSPYPGGGGAGGSAVSFVDPDNQGDAWNSIQTEDEHGEVIRYLSRQWRETWGYEKRGDITLAQTPNPAVGILAFGGGSSAVVRPIADGFPYHVVNEALVHPEDGQAASAGAAAWLEGEYAARRGLPTVVALTQVVGSTVEADALAGSAPREALKAKVVAAREALALWGKELFVDRIGLSLLEGAPNTGQATADLHYAAVAASMRAEIADAAGQIPMPVVVVSQSAGTRTDGTSPVILAEGNLDWAHWSLGFVVATPRYPFALQAGASAALTPQAAMLVSELEALAVAERLAGRDWYGPTMGAQATRSGAVITVPFTAMSDLVLRDAANHGFAVDGVINGATIQSVAVSGKNALLTMSRDPMRAWGFDSSVPEASITVVSRDATGAEIRVANESGRRYAAFPIRLPVGSRVRFHLETTGVLYGGFDDEPTLNTPRREMNPSGGWPAGSHDIDYTVPQAAASDTYMAFLFTGINATAVISDLQIDLPAGYPQLQVRYAFGQTGDRGDGYPANRGSLTDSWSQASRMVPGTTLYRYARAGRAPVV